MVKEYTKEKTKLYNIINYIFVIIASLPLFTVYIFSDILVNGRYTAKTFYFYFVTLFIFAIVAIYFLFNKKTIKIELSKLDLAILTFCLYGFIRMLFTPNVPFFNTRFLTHSMLLGLYFIWKYFFKIDPLNKKIFLLILLFMGMGQAIYGLLQLYNILPVPPNIGGFKVFGNFGNPSPYASFLGPFIPLSLGVYLLSTKKNVEILPPNNLNIQKINSKNFFIDELLRNVGLFTFLFTLLVIPVTNSRSAWLGAIVGIGVVLKHKYSLFYKLYHFFTQSIKKKKSFKENGGGTLKLPFDQTLGNSGEVDKRVLRPWRLCFFVVLALSLIVTSSFFIYNYKKDSAFGRVLQWKITTNMIKDKPIFGQGFNSYGIQYNSYQSNYFASGVRSEQEKLIAGNSQQAHNEYLEIFAEFGFVGILLFVALLFLIIKKFLILLKNQNIIGIISFAGVVAYLVECLFTYPLQIIPSLVIIGGLVSLFSGSENYCCDETLETDNSQQKSISLCSFWVTMNKVNQKIIALILLAFILTLSFSQYKNYKAHQDWNVANSFSAAQQYDVSLKIYKELYPTLKSNGSFLLNYGGSLALKNKYSDAIPILEEAKKYINDPNLFLSLGNCYKESGVYKKAESNYIKVENIVPHQMYPKYLLVKLYEKMNDHEKLKTKANEIVNMNIKINSTAIYEMQEDVKRLLGKG